jgi:MoaA/NifB/PqqE/SkfB family radical SAM enzyme
MKLLVEILGMTTYCNLRCTYCDWKMKPTKRLDDAGYRAADKNIRRVWEVVRDRFASAVLVEYSGGEPFVYPRIVQSLLDTFPDKWLRVSTNGSLIDAAMIGRIAKSKAYMCVSLDGSSIEANAPRFGKNLAVYARVNETITALLAAGVPVVILCTLNTKNIDAFPEYVRTLSQRYCDAIASGLLMMPAHCVSEYERENGKPTFEQAVRFADFIRTQGRKFPIVAKIIQHYERLADFLAVSTYKLYLESNRLHELPDGLRRYWQNLRYARTCFLYDWQVSFHFLDDAIASDEGVFKSWGCGMRAVEDLGVHSVHAAQSLDEHLSRIESPERNSLYRGDDATSLGHRCGLLKDCLVDWNVFDMIFSGEISLEDAQAWSVLFRDPMMVAAVQASVQKYGPSRRDRWVAR